MYKEQIKKELRDIIKNENEIDNCLVNIKVAIHTLEKLGIENEDLNKLLDNVGIEFYKFKSNINETIFQ